MVYGHLANKMYISSECPSSGRPSTHSPQNARTVQLGASQHICCAAVKFRQAHRRPALPFGPSANNYRSEHIHWILLSDVTVTTEQHQGKCIVLILGKKFIRNVFHFLLLNLKYLQIFNCVSFVNIYNLCSCVTF